MNVLVALRLFFRRQKPADPYLWHEWSPLLPVRLVDGGWSYGMGRTWRRKTRSGWEFREEPDEEALDDLRQY